jgi:hypothetical protein
MDELYDVTITVMKPDGTTTVRQEVWTWEELFLLFNGPAIWRRPTHGIVTAEMLARDRKPSYLSGKKRKAMRMNLHLAKYYKSAPSEPDYVEAWRQRMRSLKV